MQEPPLTPTPRPARAPERRPANEAGRRADLDLVRRALRGDRRARAELVERMRCIPRVLAAKNARSGRPLQAADLADLNQETFALIWQRAEEYRGEAALETWATSFALHLFSNAVRRVARDARRIESRSVEPAAFSKADDTETGAVLLDAIAALDADQAIVVRMKKVDGLDFPEIAERLALPIGTAKSRYSRALSALRLALGPKRMRGAI